MKVNFDITDNHVLTVAGRHIDLHNNFDFIGFDYNIADWKIKQHWNKESYSPFEKTSEKQKKRCKRICKICY